MPNSRRAFPASGSLAHVEPMAPLHQDWSNWGISYDTGPQDPNKSGFWPCYSPFTFLRFNHYTTTSPVFQRCCRAHFAVFGAPRLHVHRSKPYLWKSAGYTELHHPQSPQWPEMDGGSRYFKGSPPGARKPTAWGPGDEFPQWLSLVLQVDPHYPRRRRLIAFSLHRIAFVDELMHLLILRLHWR